ncbi:MAG: preprotein translocase subunit YajC [Thermoguttaceae bacterium]
MNIPVLFAQEVPSAAPSSGDPFGSILVILPLFLILYWFLMLRPQQKQEETRKKMVDSLDRNDRVMTVGGMYGIIHSIDKEKNEVVLKIDDTNNTKVHFHISAIIGKTEKEETK